MASEELESKIALPESSVMAWTLFKTNDAEVLIMTFWLLTPSPRESNKKIVRRIFSWPSALAVRGEANKYEFWILTWFELVDDALPWKITVLEEMMRPIMRLESKIIMVISSLCFIFVNEYIDYHNYDSN